MGLCRIHLKRLSEFWKAGVSRFVEMYVEMDDD